MRVFAALAGMTGWVALALQFYLSVVNGSARGLPAGELVLRYVSFFTILTNMLVALVLTQAVLAPGRGILGRPAVQAATAGYIAVVGLIYVVILRHTWAPTGLQWWVDVALHYAMPLLYLAFWLAFAAKGRLRWAGSPIPGSISPGCWRVARLRASTPIRSSTWRGSAMAGWPRTRSARCCCSCWSDSPSSRSIAF